MQEIKTMAITGKFMVSNMTHNVRKLSNINTQYIYIEIHLHKKTLTFMVWYIVSCM